MAVNLTTASLVDYLKSVDGFSCTSSSCKDERIALWAQYAPQFGYPTTDFEFKGWQNKKLLDYIKNDISPPFHDPTYVPNLHLTATTVQDEFNQVNPNTGGYTTGIYKTTNIFNDLHVYIANSENSGRMGGVERVKDDGNLTSGKGGDYHLGYWQVSGWNINTLVSYVKHYLSPNAPGLAAEPFITHRAKWDEWYIDVFNNAWEDVKANRHNTSCSKFWAPGLFDLDHQMFFQTIFLADSIKSYTELTMEQLVLNNLLGAAAKMQYWGEPWTKENMTKNIYWNKPQYAALYPWDYLQNSHIPGLPPHITNDAQFKKVFTTYFKREDALKDFEQTAIEIRKKSPSLASKINEDAIAELFKRKHLYTMKPNHWNKDYKPPIVEAPIAAPSNAPLSPKDPSSPASIPTVDPNSQLADPGNVVNLDVERNYQILSEDPKFYKQGVGADSMGAIYIGDILISIPPVSLRFSESNQSMAIPTMRTDGDPIFTSNNTVPRVDLTLYFNGENAINQQLRPLLAMFQRMPFSTIQNTTIWKAWLGRRSSLDTTIQDNMNQFAPIPCYLENIAVSTLPGFPNTVQAHLSVIRMNRSPYGHSARMWKNWSDAAVHSKRRTLRGAKDNTLYDTHRDENTKTDYLYIMDSSMKSHKLDLPDSAAAGNPILDPILTTQYPIESVPFKYQYRSILFDDGMPLGFQGNGVKNVGKTIYGKMKDPLTHWPPYRAQDNEALFLSYKSAKNFRSPTSVFKGRLRALTDNFTRIQQLTKLISQKSTPELLEIYKPINDIDYTALATTMVQSLSAVKTGIKFNQNLNQAFGVIINEVIMDTQAIAGTGSFGNPFTAMQTQSCEGYPHLTEEDECKAVGGTWQTFDTWGYTQPLAPHALLPIPAPVSNSAFRYVNEKGEVVDTMNDFLDYINGIAGNTGFCTDHPEWPHYETCIDQGGTWKAAPETDEEKAAVVERTRALMEPFYLYMNDPENDYFGLGDLDEAWNYETVGIQFEWLTDEDELAIHHETAQHLIDENDHIERETSRLINPRLYQFQSVLQSVSYSFSNQVAPFFTVSHNIPAYQHMGIPAPSANIILRTRDERLLKIITDMKESIQEIGSQMLAGNTRLAGLGTVDVSGNIFSAGSDRKNNNKQLLSNTGPLSGHLLNSLGFAQASVQNISTRNIEGSPGWWEVSLDLISNTQNIRILEHLNAASAVDIPEDIHILMGDVFPSQKIDYTPLMAIFHDSHEYKQKKQIEERITYLEAEIAKAKAKTSGSVLAGTAEGNAQHGGMNARRFIRTKRKEVRELEAADQVLNEKNFGFQASQLLQLQPSEFFTTYLERDAAGLPSNWILYINSERTYAIGTKDGKTSNTYSVQQMFRLMLSPMMNKMVSWLRRIEQWEEAEKAKDQNYADSYPDMFNLSGTLLSYYNDYLNNVIHTISGLAHKDANIFVSHRRFGVMPGYTHTAKQVSDQLLKDPQIIMQTVILANQIRTIFYQMMRRSDFRKFLDSQIIPRNAAINELLEGLIEVENSWNAGFSLNLQVGSENYSIHETEKGEAADAIRAAIMAIKNSDEYIASGNVSSMDTYSLFLKQLNENIKENHPDLRLAKNTIEETGHNCVGPGFAFVDDDLNLELIEMSKLGDKIKMVTFAQLAAVTSGEFTKYYEDIESYLGEWKTVNGEKVFVENDAAKSLNTLLTGSFTAPDEIDYHLPSSMSSAGFKKSKNSKANVTDVDRGTLSIPMMLSSLRTLSSKEQEIQEALSKGAKELMGTTAVAPTKQAIMDLMSSTAMLDYLIHLLTVSSYIKEIDAGNIIIEENIEGATDQMKKDLSSMAGQVTSQLAEMDIDGYTLNKLLADAVQLPYSESIGKSGTAHDLAVSLLEDLLSKRRDAASIATLSSTGDYQGFLNYFGIGDLNSVKRSFELKQKFTQMIAHKNNSSMERAFPAFKIFFIEEDGYAWQAFDDFYTYDAASEITIIESKHSASTTAILKLSNVTQTLTNDIPIGIMNEMMSVTPGALLRLKVGSPIMVMVGYGADYRQLRMKFKGAVTEMKPGAVLELTCQSWGAGLLNAVGASGGIDYKALSGATTLGAAVLDVLSQTPGLSGLGRWEIRDPKLNDPSKVTETHLRNSWHARALNSVAGWVGDHISIDTNIKDIVGTLTTEGGMPTDGKSLKEAWRTNNVIVKSMGNSLYDNIIINNTDPSGYGFYNYFSRAKSWLSSLYEEKSFKWHVVRQTAWDALHECALFLGDYIITTRPFNEGNDIFNNPPRETLYFGPREGQYRSKTFVPKINESVEFEKLKDLINSIVVPPKGSTAYDQLTAGELETLLEDQADLNNKLIGFGKLLMSKVIDYHLQIHDVGGNHGPGFDPGSASRMGSYRRRERKWVGGKCDSSTSGRYKSTTEVDIYHPKDLLMNFRYTLNLNQFKNVATLIKECEIINTECFEAWTGSNMYGSIREGTKTDADMRDCTDEISGATIVQLLNYTDNGAPPKNVVKELLLADWEHEYNAPGTSYQSFPYTTDEWRVLEEIRQGKVDLLYPAQFTKEGRSINGEKLGNFWSYGAGGDTDFEQRHWDDWDNAKFSVFPWVFGGASLGIDNADQWGECGNGMGGDPVTAWGWTGADILHWGQWRKYLMGLDEAILKDVTYVIMNYEDIEKNRMKDYKDGVSKNTYGRDGVPEGTFAESTADYAEKGIDLSFGRTTMLASGAVSGFNPILFDLQDALMRNGSLLSAFAFSPVIDHHMVNSYEDIIDNQIVATADQMYNHVEVLFPEAPDPESSVTNAKYRTQAMISHDQDPDYLRTYQTYQKNIDYSAWYDMTAADSVITQAEAGGSAASVGGERIIRATGLDQTVVAQSILMNQVRPMYQGTMTTIGNPHIKPWDIIHIHDDSIGMYGPIEVEQVVTHMSVAEGYTTTVVPNMLVYYKGASRAMDGLIMNIHSRFNSLNYWLICAKWGILATVGLGATQSVGTFGTSSFRTFPLLGRMLGLKQLNTAAIGWEKASQIFKKNNVEGVLANKKLAKKFLTKAEFKVLEGVAVAKQAETTAVNIAVKHSQKRLGTVTMASMTTNPALIKEFAELDRLMAMNSNTPNNQAMIERCKRRIAKVLGKGDLTKGLSKLKTYTNRWDIAQKQLRKTIDILNSAAPNNVKVRRLAAKVDKLDEAIKLLNKLKTVKVEGQLRGRPYVKLGNQIVAAEKQVAKLTAGLSDDVGRVGNTVRRLIRKKLAKQTTKVIANGASKLTMRTMMGAAAKIMIPYVGWAWVGYDVWQAGREIFGQYARGKIFLSSLMTGENQLTFLPLEYQGKDYVAGLEGILGTPRSSSTIIYGELTGDLTASNRGFLEMSMLARFDYDSDQ